MTPKLTLSLRELAGKSIHRGGPLMLPRGGNGGLGHDKSSDKGGMGNRHLTMRSATDKDTQKGRPVRPTATMQAESIKATMVASVEGGGVGHLKRPMQQHRR